MGDRDEWAAPRVRGGGGPPTRWGRPASHRIDAGRPPVGDRDCPSRPPLATTRPQLATTARSPAATAGSRRASPSRPDDRHDRPAAIAAGGDWSPTKWAARADRSRRYALATAIVGTRGGRGGGDGGGSALPASRVGGAVSAQSRDDDYDSAIIQQFNYNCEAVMITILQLFNNSIIIANL